MTNLHFITSSRIKLSHARHIATSFDVCIRGKRNYGIAYEEPRLSQREELLRLSHLNALERWIRTGGSEDALLFIEDTSVIIEALSHEAEYPGTDVKFWMHETSFQVLDRALREAGNNRRVTVRSDVVLHLPRWFRDSHNITENFLIFTGQTSGTIVDREQDIQTNLLYPWLDNKTFNKWFIPENGKCPLSSMPIDEADLYDFRSGSIGAMLEYLASKGVLRRHEQVSAYQERVLPFRLSPLLIVTGLPCSGKTTLGEFLSRTCNYYHMEASDFMKRAFYERHGYNSTLSIHDFAEKALIETPDIVVKEVLEEIRRSNASRIIVTGFRSPKEIDILQFLYSGDLQIISWHVKAREELRFKRSVKRARKDAAKDLAAFRERDVLQGRMGLDVIEAEFSDSVIDNNSSTAVYLEKCLQLAGLQPSVESVVAKRYDHRPRSLEDAILISLAAAAGEDNCHFTTTEIASIANRVFAEGLRANKNNVSRYFNFRPRIYYSIDSSVGKLRFKLSATGLSRALRVSDTLQKVELRK